MTLNAWPPGIPGTVRHNVLAKYIQDTAAKHGVDEVAQYNTKVEHVEKEGDHWNLRTSTLNLETLKNRTREWVSSLATSNIGRKLNL